MHGSSLVVWWPLYTTVPALDVDVPAGNIGTLSVTGTRL